MRRIIVTLSFAAVAMAACGGAVAGPTQIPTGSLERPGPEGPTPRQMSPPTSAPSFVAATIDPESGLPWAMTDLLPAEALETLVLIDRGGPFPFDRDGATFQNREGLLPDRPGGHYREYTVITPSSDDRGARRIVAGADGERYYTDDHYDSFSRIVTQ